MFVPIRVSHYHSLFVFCHGCVAVVRCDKGGINRGLFAFNLDHSSNFKSPPQRRRSWRLVPTPSPTAVLIHGWRAVSLAAVVFYVTTTRLVDAHTTMPACAALLFCVETPDEHRCIGCALLPGHAMCYRRALEHRRLSGFVFLR